jgi:Tfp pilus assembly PilM family ATPase
VIEHQILERQEAATPPHALVLLIAARKSLVEKYVKIIEMAGLTVVGVETELMSIVRSIAPLGKTAVVVDFGARAVDIALSFDGNLYFSRSVAVAGEALSRSVAQGLNVSMVQAEEYKRTYGLMADQLEGKVREVLVPVVDTIAEEIKKAIHYYNIEVKQDTPVTVLLTGVRSSWCFG